MRPSKPTPVRRGTGSGLFWDLLTFEHLMTNQVIHLIYWAGLGVIALIAFGFVGTAVGVPLGGFLVVGALILLWRSFCELYVALFRLSDDLHAIRQATDAEYSARPVAPPPPPRTK